MPVTMETGSIMHIITRGIIGRNLTVLCVCMCFFNWPSFLFSSLFISIYLSFILFCSECSGDWLRWQLCCCSCLSLPECSDHCSGAQLPSPPAHWGTYTLAACVHACCLYMCAVCVRVCMLCQCSVCIACCVCACVVCKSMYYMYVYDSYSCPNVYTTEMPCNKVCFLSICIGPSCLCQGCLQEAPHSVPKLRGGV